jgi:hypothetical protein
MTKNIILALTLFTPIAYLLANQPQYNITQIDSYAQATQTLASADENTLVLFDVDYTLIMPETVMCRKKVQKEHAAWFKELVEHTLKNSSKSKEYIQSLQRAHDNARLIEPEIPHMIESLQKRGVKVIALTALQTGSFHTIPSLPVWRFNKLLDVGINLSSIPYDDEIFETLQPPNSTSPVLYRGILCSTTLAKGLVVGAFLDRIGWTPSQVIFFDDHLTRVKEVAQEMQLRDIPFCGFHYRGADKVPGELNKELATLQYTHLVQYEEWLNDAAAEALLHPQPIAVD